VNLIKKTLFVVFLVQLLIFSYIKIFHEKGKETLISEAIANTTPLKTKNPTINKEYVTSIVNSTISNLVEKHRIEEQKIQKQKIAKQKVILPKKSKIKTKCYAKNSPKKTLLKKTYSSNSKIEKYAKKFLGNKYVWGATGPKTFDCSGFTQKVYRQSAGIRLPRVSREQAKVGKYIKYANLKQGDMVFFDTTKEKLGKVNHVGIYLKNGNFIHASSGGKKVMITNFNKKRFYKKRFLWGRRVLKESNNVATISNNKHREES